MTKKTTVKAQKKNTKRNLEKEINILEGALKVFGEKGFEETTISAISKAAKISDATIYEYFSSKEEVLFSIPKVYTQREYDRLKEIGRYINCPKERLRAIIQAYLEFYEKNRLYTSVVMLSLKGNRNFLKSEAYQVIREASRTIVDTFNEGVQKGVFRDDIDPYLFRNMVLGFIEHLTIQWLLVERPETITQYRDQIFDMVMRAIIKDSTDDGMDLKCQTLNITISKE
jgi:TetR/AcrR family fatty acid metabolism transcriptional regulator